jgi:hypothetical protein
VRGWLANGPRLAWPEKEKLPMAGILSVKQLERLADALAAKVEKQVARVEKARSVLQEARQELLQLEAAQRRARAQLARARQAAPGRPAPADKSG